MRGGSYRQLGDGLERLNRATGEWVPCDDHGNELVGQQANTSEASLEAPGDQEEEQSV